MKFLIAENFNSEQEIILYLSGFTPAISKRLSW